MLEDLGEHHAVEAAARKRQRLRRADDARPVAQVGLQARVAGGLGEEASVGREAAAHIEHVPLQARTPAPGLLSLGALDDVVRRGQQEVQARGWQPARRP